MVSFVSYDVHCVLWCQLSGACIQTPGAESLLGSHLALGKNFLHLERPAFCFALQHVGRIIPHLLVVSKKNPPVIQCTQFIISLNQFRLHCRLMFNEDNVFPRLFLSS